MPAIKQRLAGLSEMEREAALRTLAGIEHLLGEIWQDVLAVSQVNTTEVAPVSITIGAATPLILARSANSPPWPR